MDRRAALIGLANLFAPVFVASDASANGECGRLRGTFIQPLNAQAAWSTSDWQRLFDEFKTLGIANLFIQWTVLDRIAFFRSPEFRPATAATLPIMLSFAERAGIRAWIGL
jgi:Domain of unknown function (DUF4434)